MSFFRIWCFTLFFIFLSLLTGCFSIGNSPSFRLEESLKSSWRKEKEILKKLEKAQDESSFDSLYKEVEKIKEELAKNEVLLKNLSKEKKLSKFEIKKYQHCFSLLVEIARDIDSFLTFQLSAKEENKILTELGWRLTLLSGQLAASFNLISKGNIGRAKGKIERVQAELSACRKLINRLRQCPSLGLERINDHLDKIEFLVSIAESLATRKWINEEEREKANKMIKEIFPPSLDILSLSELNRNELIKEANMKLEEIARRLDNS